MRSRWWCVGAVSVGLLVAGSSAEALERLSIDQAMEEAVRRAPTVREARREIEAAEGNVLMADGAFDPNLSLDGGWNRSTNRQRFGQFPDPFRIDSDGWDVGMNLSAQAPTGTTANFSSRFRESTATVRLDSEAEGALGAIFGGDQVQKTFQPSFNFELGQELLRGLRLRTGLRSVRQAKEARTLAELRLEQAKQQAMADASRQYWSWVYLQQVVEIEREGVETAREALRVGEARVAMGQAAPVERSRLEAAFVQASVELINAENEAARARDELLITLGRQPGEDVEATSVPGEVPEVHIDEREAMAQAREFSVDLALARAQLEQARAALMDARHAMLPQLTASINAGLNGFDDTRWGDAFQYLDTLLPTIGARGTLTVPLGNRVAAGDRNRSSAEVARAEVAVERAEAQLAMALAAQVRALRVARRQVDLADANLRLARETLEAEEARHEAGRVLLQEVLEARVQAQRAEAEAVRTRTDFRVAEVEFRRIQGLLGTG